MMPGDIVPYCADAHRNAERRCYHGDIGPVCAACAFTLYHRDKAEQKAARKAKLAAMPRCEACDKRRGSWRYGPVLLCGRCLKIARRASAKLGAIGAISLQSSGTDVVRRAILTWTQGGATP
jgi:hypothetical protein